MPKKYTSLTPAQLISEGYQYVDAGKKIPRKLATHIWAIGKEEASYYDVNIFNKAKKIHDKYYSDPRVKKRLEKARERNRERSKKINKMMNRRK